MSGHTPGPWMVREVHVGRSNTAMLQVAPGGPGMWVVCQIVRGNRSWSEREANAHLIAAAPELLEAAKVLLSYMVMQDEFDTRALEAAIDKAEGGTK